MIDKKGKAIYLAFAGLFAISVFMGDPAASAAEKTETISQGVHIGDVDVSGMTAQEAEDAVNAKLKQSQGSGYKLKLGDHEITATAKDFGLSWDNTQVCEEAARLGKSGNIIKRYKETKDLANQGMSFALDYAPDEEKVKAFVNKIAEEYDSEATEGTIGRDDYGNLTVTGGEDGIVVDKDASVNAIMDYLESGSSENEIQLSAKIDKPQVTADELNQITDVLGTATTYYGSTYGRNTNVEVGAEKLNGILLMPGEEFSVTDAVVPFNAENGYELAPSYESGQVVDSYGGGICQVSTTLYNALLQAELQILERHNHTMIVTYVEPSMDAAIAEGLMDLRFANDTDYPIYIEGGAWGGALTFTIYGHETRPADRYVQYVSETLDSSTAEGVKLVPKYDQNVGYLNQVQAPIGGLQAVLWKYVTYNGETTTEQVNSSTYQATPAIYEVGMASDDPNVTAAMANAVAAGTLEAVQNVLTYGAGTSSTEAQETQTEEVQEPATEAPSVDTPAEAPPSDDTVSDVPSDDGGVTVIPDDSSSGDGEVIEEF